MIFPLNQLYSGESLFYNIRQIFDKILVLLVDGGWTKENIHPKLQPIPQFLWAIKNFIGNKIRCKYMPLKVKAHVVA